MEERSRVAFFPFHCYFENEAKLLAHLLYKVHTQIFHSAVDLEAILIVNGSCHGLDVLTGSKSMRMVPLPPAGKATKKQRASNR